MSTKATKENSRRERRIDPRERRSGGVDLVAAEGRAKSVPNCQALRLCPPAFVRRRLAVYNSRIESRARPTMLDNRASRGGLLPSVGQCLIVAAAVGASWLIWLELRGQQADSRVSHAIDAEKDSRAAALENLHAVEAIARTGRDGVPDLVEALADSNYRLRRNALLALRLIGPDAVEALALIRERLGDEDAQVRSLAIDACWYVRRDPDDVAALIAPMLGDREANVREIAAKVLHTIGRPALGPVFERLKGGVPAARRPALNVVRRIGWSGSQPEFDDVVRDFARDADTEVRTAALRTLATWGRPTPSEIRALLQHKEAPDSMWRNVSTEPGPRETALHAILRLGPDAAENLDDVIDFLAEERQPWNDSWSLAVAALRAMRSAARPAMPRLLQLVNDRRNSRRNENHDIRLIDAGWLLLAMGADPQEIIAIAAPLFIQTDADTCFHAGRLCAIVSPEDARRQVSLLVPELVPEKIADRMSALNAAWGLAPEGQEAIPALSALLKCDRRDVAQIAAKALGDIGPQAAPAIPLLLAELARRPNAHDRSERGAFCEALGKMGPAARSAIPALLVELNDAPLSRPQPEDFDQFGQHRVEAAISALVGIGITDSAVLAAIRRHLSNETERVRSRALRAISQLTPDSPEVLTCCLKWVQEKQWPSNRGGLILAIGRHRGNRQDAVTPLAEMLDDAEPEIRKAAAWSLGKIGPDARAALPSLEEALKHWENSLYSFHDRRYPPPSLADDPRRQLENGRWRELDTGFFGGMRDLQFQERSVQQVVREAIAAIEARSSEPRPPPLPSP
jgi:HEAT repeat protein